MYLTMCCNFNSKEKNEPLKTKDEIEALQQDLIDGFNISSIGTLLELKQDLEQSYPFLFTERAARMESFRAFPSASPALSITQVSSSISISALSSIPTSRPLFLQGIGTERTQPEDDVQNKRAAPVTPVPIDHKKAYLAFQTLAAPAAPLTGSSAIVSPGTQSNRQ